MMEEMPAVKADNIIIAEEFLNEMIDDEEKQQHEPYISLPRVKRQMHDSFSGLSRQLSARSINHNSRSNNNNGSFTCSPTPTTFLRSQSSSGSVLQNLWQKGFGGSTDHPQPSNLMDTHLARLSYESTPMGEGRLIGQTKHSSGIGMGMEDVYLDEPSRRGIRMMKRGGVSKPFRDNTRSRKTNRRTALFIMLFVGFLLAGMGLYAIARYVRSSREHDNNNSVTHEPEVEVPQLVVPSDNNGAGDAANDGDLLEAEAMALEAVKHMEEEEEEEHPAEAAAAPEQQKATTPLEGEEAPPLFQDEEHLAEEKEVVSAEEVEVQRTFNDNNNNMDSQEEDVVNSTEDEEDEDVAEVDLEGEDTEVDLEGEDTTEEDAHEDTHAALVEQEFDEELTTVQKEAEVVHEEMGLAHDPNQIDLLEKEEDALQSLEEVVAEEKEVFEEEQEAINSEDYALLKQEEINLNHQEDNVAEQANLMGDMAFASGAEVDEKTQEEEALQKVESGLQEDQQNILREEARVEGWDYDKAKKEADHLKEKQEEAATIEARRADEPQPKEEEEEETLQDQGEDGQ